MPVPHTVAGRWHRWSQLACWESCSSSPYSSGPGNAKTVTPRYVYWEIGTDGLGDVVNGVLVPLHSPWACVGHSCGSYTTSSVGEDSAYDSLVHRVRTGIWGLCIWGLNRPGHYKRLTTCKTPVLWWWGQTGLMSSQATAGKDRKAGNSPALLLTVNRAELVMG